MITELERSVHKLKQYSLWECIKITGIPQDIPHAILEGVAIKPLNKINANLTKNDIVDCQRLANSDRTIINDLNRKHADQTMNNKSKLKDMRFLAASQMVEASNTSDNVQEETSVNSPQYTRRRNPRIYINYSLCPYYR